MEQRAIGLTPQTSHWPCRVTVLNLVALLQRYTAWNFRSQIRPLKTAAQGWVIGPDFLPPVNK